jgi:hypothetical protein
MIGYKLTQEQKEIIQGQFYAPYQFINCVQDINNIWFTFFTDEDKAIIETSEYAWVLDCSQAEYVPPVYESPFLN